MSEMSPNFEAFGPVSSPIGEPVRRPDGLIVEFSASDRALHPRVGGLGTCWFHEEVATLGYGNWKTGMARIGSVLYRASSDDLLGVFDALSEECRAIEDKPNC